MSETSKLIPHEQYRNLMDIAPITTVDVLFFNKTKEKTLLFRRTNEPLLGVYFSMGGRLAKGETFLECALRKAKEELNFTLDPSKLVFAGVQEEIHPNSVFPDVSYHAVDLFYGYILEDESLIPDFDAQHDNHQWFSVSDETLHPTLKTKINQTLKQL